MSAAALAPRRRRRSRGRELMLIIATMLVVGLVVTPLVTAAVAWLPLPHLSGHPVRELLP